MGDTMSTVKELRADIGARVRVDLFKASGKWYSTCHVDMRAWYDSMNIHGAVRASCMAEAADPKGGWGIGSNINEWLREGGFAVCADPHHKNSHPVMLSAKDVRAMPNFEEPTEC